jgi:hypothetical protein
MNELITQIISKVGVDQNQAESGVGAILKFAGENMNKETYSKIAETIGGSSELIEKFTSNSASSNSSDTSSDNSSDKESSVPGGLLSSATSALGGLGGKVGGIATLVSGLSGLNLDLGTVKKFVPVISNFLQSKGLGDVATKLNGLI